ncbi:MAG: GTPase ObgE [Alphaproteobacteria bacterium]|nr:GTPase ObgE [Alphaproteobacteria bacterium]
MRFLDEAKIHVRAGDGGAGCLSFHRAAHVPRGGPDGGDGGRGGDVVGVAVAGLNTLVDFRYQKHHRAKNGRHGEGGNRTGATGADCLVRLPAGTVVLAEDKETLVADLTAVGQRVVLAAGGRGGFGNAHYKSATNRAPRRADPGQPGAEWTLWLRLKLLADAGIIGLPNAGKSTFLAAVSAARPRVADYPFTTIYPELGVVRLGDTEFVLADIPGLTAGAHAGAGLGVRFLGHIERCRVLLHLVDGTAADVAAQYRMVREELSAYGHGLAEKPEVVALTKVDALDEVERRCLRRALRHACGGPVTLASAHSGTGIRQALRRVMAPIIAARVEEAASLSRQPEPAPA